MLPFIIEEITVWERLQQAQRQGRPIVLYGMGNGADKIIDWCEAHSVKVSGIFASDEFVRGQSFRGLTVRKYADITEQFGADILIVIAFASELPEVLERFRQLERLHPGNVVAPHLPLFPEQETVSPAWLTQHEQELRAVYERLADEQSRRVFAAALNYKLSGKISYLFAAETQRSADLRQLFAFTDSETYLDLGAYNGDTVTEFLQLTASHYKKIIAAEPDRRSCRKLRALIEEKQLANVSVYEGGIWDEQGELGFSDSGGRQSSFLSAAKRTVPVTTIDELVQNGRVTYIKMDLEGAEMQALAGARRTLAQYAPKMLIAAYHYDADLFRLPLTLWRLVPDYKIYLRKHPYVPAWELNFFCVK